MISGRKNRIRKHLNKFKTDIGCVNCGYNRCASAIHFHHINPKDKIYLDTCIKKMSKHLGKA